MKKEYQSIMERVRKCKDAKLLLKMDKLSVRLYDLGMLSVGDLRRIDIAIMEKIAKLES